MARRRYFRPQDNYNRGPRVNGLIRKSPIRLIDENEEMVGVVETAKAMQMAQDAGLDLVEVAPDSDPPVCRILDFGKYKYEQSKKDKAQKAKSKSLEMKEVRLGRSMKIDPHDIEIRLNQARKFLLDGHKVQIVQNFRGREMMHKQRGFDRMKEIEELLSDIARVEVPPRLAGRRMNMIFAPDKPKVEAYKRQRADEKDDDDGKKSKNKKKKDDASLKHAETRSSDDDERSSDDDNAGQNKSGTKNDKKNENKSVEKQAEPEHARAD